MLRRHGATIRSAISYENLQEKQEQNQRGHLHRRDVLVEYGTW